MIQSILVSLSVSLIVTYLAGDKLITHRRSRQMKRMVVQLSKLSKPRKGP